jgi:hypothetical protein
MCFQPSMLRVTAMLVGLLMSQSPDDLLRRSDVGAFTPSSFRARLVLKGPAGGPGHMIEVWRSGTAQTLIRFLDDKERGKYLLRIGGQVWLLAPGAKKPVHLSPAYRLYGGATLDEILGVRLSDAYRVESATREDGGSGPVAVLELRAKIDGLLFPQVHYVVRESSGRPTSATYRLRSGREATAVEFLDWNETGPVYARHLIVKDLLRKGSQTDVEILELQERQVPPGLFSLDDPSARHALETAAQSIPKS